MALEVWTARVTYRGPDALDITRKSAGPAGLPFAPSWAIVRPMLDARARWKADRTAFVDRVIEEGDLWAAYVPAYLEEMRASYKRERAAWNALLARPVVTLLCFCTNHYQCHRFLLAQAILPKLGAAYRGER